MTDPASTVLRRLPRPGPRVLLVLLGVAGALGIAARLHTGSALWLDESLSVAIAKRPLPDLFDALRRDGSPPLYYLALHYWMELFGEGDTATRSLSMIFSLATLPVVWLCGRRLGGPSAAWGAALTLAVTPFAVRYATETRMYALVQLLSAIGVLVVLRALERPSVLRLVPVAVVSGCLALTHYWALFLLSVSALLLLFLAWRSAERRPPLLTFGALVGGFVLFLPWLPSFLFQQAHTGTPWAATPKTEDVWRTFVFWAGNVGWAPPALAIVLIGFVLLAVLGHREDRGVTLSLPVRWSSVAVLAVAFGTLVLGLLAGIVFGAGYSPRYSSVAVVPAVLVTALGLVSLPAASQRGTLVLVAWLGLTSSAPMFFSDDRTQAAVTASRIGVALQPTDVVVYCPDQLGPSVSRLLPPATDQVGYPLLDSPELIDWVDYAQRNAAADPVAIADTLDERTDGAVFVVWSPGYRTFGDQCEQLIDELGMRRGNPVTIQQRQPHFGEQERVERFPGR